MNRFPDFFIVGAPKCGTTALNDYLARHPDVFVPERKEIHFFGSDLTFTDPRPGRDAYLRLFEGRAGQKRAGEGSVWYLYSRNAAREIRELIPDARILILLRHPVDVMYSLHSQALYNGTEDLEDFAEALAAEPERRRGRRLPARFRNTMGFLYRDVVRFRDQVERYFDVFGRERTHVILFDDLKRNVAGVYREACAFLDVDPDVRLRFDVINGNKRVRSERLRDLLRFASPETRTRVQAMLPSPRLREAMKHRLRSLNTRYVPRAPMDPELRNRLEGEIRPEIEALGRLLDRDLAHRWCGAGTGAPSATSAGNDRARS